MIDVHSKPLSLEIQSGLLNQCGDPEICEEGGASGWRTSAGGGIVRRPDGRGGIIAFHFEPQEYADFKDDLRKRASAPFTALSRSNRRRKGTEDDWFPQAANLAKDGWSIRKIAKKVGVAPSTISEDSRWVQVRMLCAPSQKHSTKFHKQNGVRKAIPNTKPNTEVEM
jgi:hypothetical protein